VVAGTGSVQIVVLAFGAEPYLSDCVSSVLASVDATGRPLPLRVVLVDNGARAAVAALPADPRMQVLIPETNMGFAGGCNLATEGSDADHFVFVNSDAIVAPDAVHRLCLALEDEITGLVSGGIRLADRPELMNSVGNPVHYLGLVWAGGYGEPASAHSTATEVASISGAFFASRATTWRALGGFDERYFAYHEDTDLSLRAWQSGYRVRYLPDAVALHHYEFSRTPSKQFLLERNRWITLLTVFPRTVLLAVAAPLALFEFAILALSAGQGWLPDKVRSYRWLLRNRGYLRARRRQVRSANQLSDAQFATLLTARIEPGMLGPVPGVTVLNAALAAYWRLCLAALRARSSGFPDVSVASRPDR
jgi:GT2 family glycosyltransferase